MKFIHLYDDMESVWGSCTYDVFFVWFVMQSGYLAGMIVIWRIIYKDPTFKIIPTLKHAYLHLPVMLQIKNNKGYFLGILQICLVGVLQISFVVHWVLFLVFFPWCKEVLLFLLQMCEIFLHFLPY